MSELRCNCAVCNDARSSYDVAVYKSAYTIPISKELLLDSIDYRMKHPWLLPDPNPFPRFHLFRRNRRPSPRCTGNPCICTNGIGCVTVPMDKW